jgi:hypothetical protein
MTKFLKKINRDIKVEAPNRLFRYMKHEFLPEPPHIEVLNNAEAEYATDEKPGFLMKA